MGSAPALSLDAAGEPTVAYYDATSRDLMLAQRNGPDWKFSRVDGAGSVDWHASLALEPTGAAHLVYHYTDEVSSSTDGLKYWRQ